jgi:TonB-linked SusC/RagA family outer membrane protein
MKNLAKWRGMPSFIQKIVRVMKISVFLVLVCTLQLSASVMLGQQVSLQSADMSVRQVFKELKTQTGTFFMYSEEEVDRNLLVEVDFSDVSLEVALDEICEQAALTYEIVDDYVLITKKAPVLEKQNVKQEKKDLKGTITDDEGKSLPGVSVVVKGTNTGVATDIDGNYSISFENENAVLVFSFVGMISQEITYKGQAEINVSLASDSEGLDEVVVIGYGSVKKKDLTGSVATLDIEIIDESAATGLGDVLQGQIPGLKILAGNGSPGEPVKLEIRGIPSLLGSSDPLIVIDDTPMPEGFNIGDMNTSDIKSVNVLKGASATAIYGSRGASGIIIITTKKGKRNSKPQINYEYNFGSENLVSKIKSLTSQEFKTLYFESIINTAKEGGYLDLNSYVHYKNAIIPGFFGEHDTPWMEHLTQDANTETHKLSLRNGSENSSVYVSLGQTNKQGVVIGTGSKKTNIAVNLGTDINSWIKSNISYRQTFTTRNNNYRGLQDALGARPDIKAFNDDGTPYVSSYTSYSGAEYVIPNPIIEIGAHMRKEKASNIALSGSLDFKLIPNMKLKTRFSYFKRAGETRQYAPSNSQAASYELGKISGKLVEGENERESKEIEARLTYFKNIGKDHLINSTTAVTYNTAVSSYVSQTYNGFSDDFVQTGIWQAVDLIRSSGYKKGSALASYIQRVNYKFKNKYLFTGSIRADGSSRFSPDTRWGFFPSLATAWIINEENFLKDVSWLPFLKLRASWGKTGMGFVPEYSWRTLYTNGNYNGNPAIIPSQIGNDILKWEQTTQVDLSLDFSFMKNRIINGTINIYSKNTEGLLFPLNLSPSLGYSSTNVNFANIENKGIEFDLNTKFKIKDFDVFFGFNIGKNFNKITGLPNEFLGYPGTTFIGNSIITNGEPLGLIYGFKTDGVWQSQEEIDRYEALNPDHKYQTDHNTKMVSPGDIKYVDINGDGWVDKSQQSTDDKVILGSSRPDFQGGFNTRFKYKNFTLSTQGTFSKGGMKSWSGLSKQFSFGTGNSIKNALDVALDRWTPDNPTAKYPALKLNNTNYDGFDDFFLYDASYIKIQNISLTYNIPEKILNKMKFFSRFDIYVSSNNVHTFTKYPGPSVESYSSNNLRGSFDDSGTYPKSRTINIGLKCTIK